MSHATAGIASAISARAAVHLGDARFTVDTLELPLPAGDEAVIRVLAAGICGTDLGITASPPEYPSSTGVLGHEIVGVVESPESEQGTRVIVDPNLYCGSCEMCARHQPTQCRQFSAIGIQRPGGFAELVTVPADRLLKIDARVPIRSAALVEPLACVLHGLARVPSFSPGSVVVVLGGGPIGALFALVLERALGQAVVVSEPNATRAAQVAGRLAQGIVVHPAALEEALNERAPMGAPLVIDAVGALLDTAVTIAAPRGLVLAFGLAQRTIDRPFQQMLTLKELTITSAFTGDGHFPQAVQLIERSVIEADDLVTGVFPLEQIEEAFAVARGGEGLKVLIEP